MMLYILGFLVLLFIVVVRLLDLHADYRAECQKLKVDALWHCEIEYDPALVQLKKTYTKKVLAYLFKFTGFGVSFIVMTSILPFILLILLLFL